MLRKEDHVLIKNLLMSIQCKKYIYVFFITDFYIVFLKISVLVFFDIFMSKLLNYNFLFLN
jgi:hypothetical protein